MIETCRLRKNEIGENEINLSSAQKVRILLASCLYSNDDILLFNDLIIVYI